jgi:hypothetical protein
MGCSRSNNLLFGRVEAMVAGHTVVVPIATDHGVAAS